MRRSRPLTRSTGLRSPKARFVIYTEGKNTEPDYFRAMKRHLTGALIDIEVTGAAGVPFTLAEQACARAKALARTKRNRSSFEESDRIWVVFDRDQHPRIPEAIQKCNGSGVGIAFSNPCFELWLILHYQDFDRPDDRHAVQRYLVTLCKDYDPSNGKTTNCAQLMVSVEAAEARAEAQYVRRTDEGGPNAPPFTTVYLLTREIRLASLAHSK